MRLSTNSIDAKMLSAMFLAGAYNLKSNKEWINELNVFPVPDGDTGTNMTMTITSAVREVAGLGDSFDMMTICKAISSGSLRGARGNSGVILSQLLRGFCKGIREYSNPDIPIIADAMDKGVETAYKAVMKPKEGTILTVAKGLAQKGRELADGGETDLDHFLDEVIKYGDEVLASTPELLPVLKQAGVVDSGGQGLMQVLKGAQEGLRGRQVDPAMVLEEEEPAEEEEKAPERDQDTEIRKELKYGYSTDFVILQDKTMKLWNPKTEKDFKAFLGSIGDSILCISSEDSVRVHVNTNDPGLAVEKALMYGELKNIQIANMRIGEKEGPVTAEETKADSSDGAASVQAEPDPKQRKEVAFIAVCAGSGLEEIFRGLGVDYIISGGQTMNPSTEDVLKAVNSVNADTVFVLPNNKNIIMAANQAAAMAEDKKVIVIPTKTVPQGIAAVINYMPEVGVDANRENMMQEIGKVASAEVTYAVRDTTLDNVTIHEGDIMGIGDNGILAVGRDRDETTLETLRKMVNDSTSLISIYYGADISEDDAGKFENMVRQNFPACDVELQSGNQPIYYYILSAEE